MPLNRLIISRFTTLRLFFEEHSFSRGEVARIGRCQLEYRRVRPGIVGLGVVRVQVYTYWNHIVCINGS